MKKTLFIFVWIILSACESTKSKEISTVKNQNPRNETPVKKETPLNNEKTENKKAENKKRYFEEIFSEITFNTFTYGKNTSQGGKTLDLKLDVYQPKGDMLSKRPLIIYVHGGGFTQNSRSNIKNLGFLQTLAKSGFVVASIDYRLIDGTQSALSMPIGILNAAEDTRAAIRFFRKDIATENQFKIDTDQIILGGYSAGAITTLFTTYLNTQEKVDSFFPPLSQYVKANGGIAGNTGNEGYPTNVKGIFNAAGGISNLGLMDNSASFIYSLHGTRDATVPFGSSPQLKGSKLIHEKATELEITNKLDAPNAGHNVLFSCNECRKKLQKFLAEQIAK